MVSTAEPGNNMIDGEMRRMPAAILADIVISPKDLLFRKAGIRPWTMDHTLKLDNRRTGKGNPNRANIPAAICHQAGFAADDEV
jgi:hypothetical protein